MARKLKVRIFFGLLFVVSAAALAVAGCNAWILWTTQDRIYDSAEDIESRPVALVLGTSKNVAPDRPNLHFSNRIAAAAELVELGKAEHLLLSGYRESDYYDEPRDMAADLRELGVPESRFTTDPKGNRTIASVARAKSEFGYERIIIVSDDFHVARALFIADRLGLDAIALRSEPVALERSGKVRLRECLARVKAVIDLMLVRSGVVELDLAMRW